MDWSLMNLSRNERETLAAKVSEGNPPPWDEPHACSVWLPLMGAGQYQRTN